jgi:hypothetical protein
MNRRRLLAASFRHSRAGAPLPLRQIPEFRPALPAGFAYRLADPLLGIVVERRLVDLARHIPAKQVAQSSQLGAVAVVHSGIRNAPPVGQRRLTGTVPDKKRAQPLSGRLRPLSSGLPRCARGAWGRRVGQVLPQWRDSGVVPRVDLYVGATGRGELFQCVGFFTWTVARCRNAQLSGVVAALIGAVPRPSTGQTKAPNRWAAERPTP